MEFDASRPIWQQLAEEFTRRITVGQWPPGSKIPGVRDLAGEVGVNPNTVQRALSEMEREGLFRSERGAGRFVTDSGSTLDAAREGRAIALTDQFVSGISGLGFTRAEVEDLVASRWDANTEAGSPNAADAAAHTTDSAAKNRRSR